MSTFSSALVHRAKPKRQVLACQKILGAAGALLKPSSTSYDMYSVYSKINTTSSVILLYFIRCIVCLLSGNTTSSVVLSNSLAFSLDTGKVVIGSKYKPTKNQSNSDQIWLQDLLLSHYNRPQQDQNSYPDKAIYFLGCIALVVIAWTW